MPAAARGIELLEAAVENSSGVIEAIQSTIARGAEAIFVPGDTTVIERHRLDHRHRRARRDCPCSPSCPASSDRGTLFDVGFDFHEVGLLAGQAGRRPACGCGSGDDPDRRDVAGDPAAARPSTSLHPATTGRAGGCRTSSLRQAKVVIGPDGRRDQPDAMFEGPFDEPHDPAVR